MATNPFVIRCEAATESLATARREHVKAAISADRANREFKRVTVSCNRRILAKLNNDVKLLGSNEAAQTRTLATLLADEPEYIAAEANALDAADAARILEAEVECHKDSVRFLLVAIPTYAVGDAE